VPVRPLRRAAVAYPAGAAQIRLAAAPNFSGGGTAAVEFGAIS